ncbi:MAG TPA: phosphoribosylglycinamide formyltransferase [Chitinophagaceae bacterium]|nr:phosphoribosylglycinamide formyltransferase [Chitinophagaceae bacterium]
MNPDNLIIFASGTGSNAQKIIDFFRNNPSVKISLIVCNKAGAGVLDIAAREHIPTLLIEKEQFFRGNGYVDELKAFNPRLIILAGFLWKLPAALVRAFPHQIINIHPALLPKYGGKGMYGHFVHDAVIAAQDAETGITIHFVDELYDHGDYIFQAKIPVEPGDTPDSIAKKVQALEHSHFPRVISELLDKKAEA